MKFSSASFVFLSLFHHCTVGAEVETHRTRAQLLKDAGGYQPDVLTDRDLISPGPPFLCQNGDPLHNASKWEYFEECLDVDTCEVSFGGYSARGPWCGSPYDNSNRCCVESLCAAPYDSTEYSCVDTERWPYCNKIVGGKDLCPGPDSVRCCS
ncbi:hypothetical protein N0V93_003729 [Gnomoniopsis smithogilvyi]|uniref:Uncharacterized protein n=1 Tax=Gnomoniopsis smithogilvyi TaxID=1191159 RepID=A0A9W9CZE8_9PEZI|nr:hypothetical protein N0V93_003729 [Gnomoniopsis smithogilvyi]